MELIYIAGPFGMTEKQKEALQRNNEMVQASEDLLDVSYFIQQNIARAVEVALQVAKAGFMPICPHANTSDPRFIDCQGGDFWYAGTLELMRRCDGVLLMPTWQESKGARAEEQEARDLGIPVYSSLEELILVAAVRREQSTLQDYTQRVLAALTPQEEAVLRARFKTVST